MAVKERIPGPIVDIIRAHHGDTVALYFYDKAVKEYGGDVDIDAFRYEGPRPVSREAAIVMLADTVEAATRTLTNPNQEKIEQLNKTIEQQKQTIQKQEESLQHHAHTLKATQEELKQVYHSFFGRIYRKLKTIRTKYSK